MLLGERRWTGCHVAVRSAYSRILLDSFGSSDMSQEWLALGQVNTLYYCDAIPDTRRREGTISRRLFCQRLVSWRCFMGYWIKLSSPTPTQGACRGVADIESHTDWGPQIEIAGMFTSGYQSEKIISKSWLCSHRLVASFQFYRLVATCRQFATSLSISSSYNKSVKIRLVAACHLQTCYNLLEITWMYNEFLQSTCSKSVDNLQHTSR